ncbi:ABC transporter permease [Alloscardovia venturai]|uniref:ABC transporter permease n=1 Tax=Alloscardovia venturai TaxID=1769421 RepID=A0ABW2Y7B3_9BIFI
MASPINKLMGANLRHHASRYVSTAIAVTIAATFVVMALTLVGGVTKQYMQTIENSTQGTAAVVSVTKNMEGNDTGNGASATQSADYERSVIAALQSIDGVKDVVPSTESLTSGNAASVPEGTGDGSSIAISASGDGNTYNYAGAAVFLTQVDGIDYGEQVTYVQTSPLYTPSVISGKLPAASNEVALDASEAKSMKVKLGDTISVRSSGLSAESVKTKTTIKVVGILASSKFRRNSAVMTREGVIKVAGENTNSYKVIPTDSHLYSPRATAASQEKIVKEIQSRLQAQKNRAKEYGYTFAVVPSSRLVSDASKSAQAVVTPMLAASLIFPLIAAFVAAIIVGTTFQVIALQRRRELALLRAVGAQARQVRALIFRETSLAGIISSFIGVAIGSVVGACILLYLEVAATLPLAFAMLPWKWIGVTWVVSSLITIIVGVTPARRASSVSPLSALAPVESVQEEKRSHRVRIVLGLILLAISVVGIIYGLRMPQKTSTEIYARFGLVFISTLVCWIAVMILFTVVLPRIIYYCGAFVRTPVGRLARENVVRNPSRTASTGIAVIIGVVLMTTISVGVASVRYTITNYFNVTMPIDVTVGAQTGGFLSDKQISQLESFKYKEKSIVRKGTLAAIKGEDQAFATVIGQGDINSIARSHVKTVANGTVHVAKGDSLAEKKTVTLCFLPTSLDTKNLEDPSSVGQHISAASCKKYAVVKDGNVDIGKAVLSDHDMNQVTSDTRAIEVNMRISDKATYLEVLKEFGKIDGIYENGGFITRGIFTQILDIIVQVFLALLAVAVVISLVGVANTLGLSVVERTRENGLLRALGLSRGQMKWLLVWESFLTSFISTIVGMVLGVIFAVIGMYTLPLEDLAGGIHIAFNWTQMVGLLAIIVVASVIAAWLPGRRAAKVSPVEALAHD